MTIISGYFDELEFWDSCYFSKPIIKNTQLIIPSRNIGLYEGHPLNNTDQLTILQSGKLIFSGIQRSERVIGEYLGEPNSGKGFKPSYTIVDGPFRQTDEPTTKFFIEGILEEPLSYVTWEIESVSFHLEV
ncbi:hypothetical protein A6770_22005 [Nostoc minutum NIES-26]|uniref:Uncharacterized protein n=1 Tax=Nostoc minutum NIES-26 TaxID=1844469 RepID=A0A367QZN3_9NOSO|nr:hypothetical protein A6770_22005 [Nostoc minutum NIES-26]